MANDLAAAGCRLAPKESEIRDYYRYYEQEAAAEIAELTRRYEAGEMTRDSYENAVRLTREGIPRKVNDAVFRDHQMREVAAGRIGEPYLE